MIPQEKISEDYPYPLLYQAVGEVVKLMMCSKAHRHYTMDHIDRLVLPALIKQKCHVFYNKTDGDMIGFISYTFLNPRTETKYLNRSGLIDWDDWSTRPDQGNLWVMDVIAPFGGGNKMCRETAKEVGDKYPGRRVFFRRSLQNDRVSSVVLLNRNVIESEGVH
tara:strand:+ start:63 stop:554 length:492 start_codon:yes stop_codon:yes gene_type:complete